MIIVTYFINNLFKNTLQIRAFRNCSISGIFKNCLVKVLWCFVSHIRTIESQSIFDRKQFSQYNDAPQFESNELSKAKNINGEEGKKAITAIPAITCWWDRRSSMSLCVAEWFEWKFWDCECFRRKNRWENCNHQPSKDPFCLLTFFKIRSCRRKYEKKKIWAWKHRKHKKSCFFFF